MCFVLRWWCLVVAYCVFGKGELCFGFLCGHLLTDCTRSLVASYQGKVFEVYFEFSTDDAVFRISVPNADDHFHLCSIPTY